MTAPSPRLSAANHGSPRASSLNRSSLFHSPVSFQFSQVDFISMGMSQNHNEYLSLRNFDENRVVRDDEQAILLSSPRSIQACLETGISPFELLKKDIEYFRLSNNGKPEDVNPQILKLRHDHYERKRQQKMRTVLEKYEQILSGVLSSPRSSIGSTHSESIVIQRISKTMNLNRAHAAKSLRYKLEQQKVQIQKEKDLEEIQKYKEEKFQKVLSEKERRKEHAKEELENFKRKTEYMMRFQELQNKEKQEKLEEKNRNAELSVEQAQKFQNEMNDLKRKYNNNRFKVTKQNQNELYQEKERKHLLKEMLEEEKQRNFLHLRTKMQNDMKKRNQEKEQRLKIVVSKADLIQKDKILLLTKKQEEEERRAAERQAEFEKEQERKRLQQEELELKRLQIIEQAKLEEELRKQQALEKQAQQEEALQRQKERLELQESIDSEKRKLREMDRIEANDRAKRLLEYKKMKTEQRIQEKIRRNALLELEKRQTEAERERQMSLVQKSKKIIETLEYSRNRSQTEEALLETLNQLDNFEPLASPDTWKNNSDNFSPRNSFKPKSRNQSPKRYSQSTSSSRTSLSIHSPPRQQATIPRHTVASDSIQSVPRSSAPTFQSPSQASKSSAFQSPSLTTSKQTTSDNRTRYSLSPKIHTLDHFI